MRDAGCWRSRTSRSSGTFHVAAGRRWGPQCEPWLSLKIEVQPTSLDGGGSDLWVWAVVFCCDSCASPLVHSWFFPFVSENWFSLSEFWVNTNGWLRRPRSGAVDGFARTILGGGVQLYVTDFVSGPTWSQAPRSSPLWGPFSVPVLAVPGGAQLVTFNRPIPAILPDLKGILEKISTCIVQDNLENRMKEWRFFSTFLGVQESLQMLATDSVAILMSPGCEPGSVLVFSAVFRDTGVFFA